ncbi:MAG TPA: hypothetical protein DF614_02110 [Methylococcaceae bacterium]|nr:hypothetical protein [Methylococcaceae bacterium]
MENQDILSSTALMGNVGEPFLLGFAVGYFAKKMLRFLLFLGGGIVVILFAADYYGVIHLSDSQLLHATDVAAGAAKKSSDFLLERLSQFTAKGMSASGGFLLGFKMA